MIRCFCVTITTLGLLCWVPALAKTPQEIAKQAAPSTVLIVTEDANGQPLALGTGFSVGKGKLVTNFHVIEGGVSGYVRVAGQKAKHDIAGFLAVDKTWDLAVLKVNGLVAPALPLADSLGEVGDTVYVVGNPRGLEATFSKGIVSSIRHIASGSILQITAPISPGSSGGPVMNNNGEVIGVAVATLRGGQNLNFAIPSEHIKRLLSKDLNLTPMVRSSSKKSDKSIFDALQTGNAIIGVAGGKVQWRGGISGSLDSNGDFTFTLKNKLRQPVSNITFLVIFYDRDNNPVDYFGSIYTGTIPSRLARRATGRVDPSIKPMTTPISRKNQFMYALEPSTKVEIRILGFDVKE